MQAKTGATSKNSEDFPGDAISQHSEPSASGSSEKDTFRIFVCTDNHLGANEKDPIRGNDSFIAFEECLQYAKDNNADFVLLGGDLFHENKPSRSCLVKTIELLRKYCLNDKPISFQMLNKPEDAFGETKFCTPNYEDQNINVGIPVFTIHGNHDDPAGEGGYAALDILQAAGLVNYFGKTPNVDEITVHPLLLAKGDSRVAIYGIGNIRDERLYRSFEQSKVTFLQTANQSDQWFNIMVLHQNRIAHSQKNYIHDNFLPSFLDLVVWGHEHESIPTPTKSEAKGFHIVQPGSTIPVALTEAEAKPKHACMLEVHHNLFRVTPVPLKTQRVFLFEELEIPHQVSNVSDTDTVESRIYMRVEQMLAKASDESVGIAPEKGKTNTLPIIRLRVNGMPKIGIHPQRLGQRFVGRVANPEDMVYFAKQKVERKKKSSDGAASTDSFAQADTADLDSLVKMFMGDSTMKILQQPELEDAVKSFVEKDNRAAITDFVLQSLHEVQNKLRSDVASLKLVKTSRDIVDEKSLESAITEFKAERNQSHLLKNDEQEITNLLAKISEQSAVAYPDKNTDKDGNIDEQDEPIKVVERESVPATKRAVRKRKAQHPSEPPKRRKATKKSQRADFPSLDVTVQRVKHEVCSQNQNVGTLSPQSTIDSDVNMTNLMDSDFTLHNSQNGMRTQFTSSKCSEAQGKFSMGTSVATESVSVPLATGYLQEIQETVKRRPMRNISEMLGDSQQPKSAAKAQLAQTTLLSKWGKRKK